MSKDEGERREFPGDVAERTKAVPREVRGALGRRKRAKNKLEKRTIRELVGDAIWSSRR